MDNLEKKRTLRIFGLASFMNDFGSDMIFPLWPVFVTSALGAPVWVLGFIDGMGDALVALSQAASGYMADKTGKRKIFVWLGYAMAGIARVGYAFSSVWQMLIPFRSLDRLGKMRGAPRNAIVADISSDTNRGRNFGYLRTMDNAGAICGVLFAIAFFPVLGYQKIFLIAAIPSFIGALMIWRSVKEEPSERKIFKGLGFSGLSRDLKLYFLSSALYALATFSYSFLLLIVAANGFKTVTLPIFYLVFTVAATFMSLAFGKLADRIGRKPVLLISMFLWAAMSLVFMSATTWQGLLVAFVLYGLNLASGDPVKPVIASELASAGARTSVLGAHQFIVGVMAFPASFGAGLLWHSFGGATIPLIVSSVLALLSGVVLLFVRETKSITD